MSAHDLGVDVIQVQTAPEVSLQVAAAGPPQGAPVLLLHGFPDTASTWRHVMPGLAKAGYRVYAPDLRGCGASSRPRTVADYAVPHLVTDLVAVLAHLAPRRPTHVIGHDWGGALAWALARSSPQLAATLTVLNCPTLSVLRRALATPSQMLKSWYMAWFQVPYLPERTMQPDKLAALVLRHTRPGAVSDADIDVAKADWARGMGPAIHWYRAMLRSPPSRLPDPLGRIPCPTLLLWGVDDHTLGRQLAAPSLRRCDDARLRFLSDAGHWPQLDAPKEVVAEVVQHLHAHGGPDPWLYKIVHAGWRCPPEGWRGNTDDLRDGFVHLSAARQVARTLHKWFEADAELELAAVDTSALPPGTLAWEASGSADRFPHIHGLLPADAVVRTDALAPRDGSFALPASVRH